MAHTMSQSVAALKKRKQFAPLIKKHGPPDFTRYHGKRGIFESLLRSIVYQQLSGHAAKAIHARICVLYPKNKPTPELVRKTRAPKLRKAGLSAQKVAYIKDLARYFENGSMKENEIRHMGSAEIIAM